MSVTQLITLGKTGAGLTVNRRRASFCPMRSVTDRFTDK
jgi:hypothetical protein